MLQGQINTESLVQRRQLAQCLTGWSCWRDIPSTSIAELMRPLAKGAESPAYFKWLKERWEGIPAALDRLQQEALLRVNGERLLSNAAPSYSGLQAYFLSKAAKAVENRFQNCWRATANNRTASDEDVALALSSLAKTAHSVLGGLPLGDDVIQSLIWLLSDYVHHELQLPERIDLRAHLLQAARHEPALHALKSYYRDHFFHALEVCFLGHYLLDLDLPDGWQLWRHVAARLGASVGQTQVLRLWYLTALLHDVGYLVDVLQGVKGQLKFCAKAKPLASLAADLDAAMKRLSNELGAESFIGYCAGQKPGEDHGVIGARHLQGLLESISGDDPSVRMDDYQPAVRAIGYHNSHKFTVSFQQDPLAFLLILCDTIQEWNRPSLSFAMAPAQILALLVESAAGEWQQAGPLEELSITKAIDVNQSGLFFHLNYDESIQRNSNVFRLWLDASCNLQRLHFGDLPPDFNIKIKYSTPPFQSPSAAPVAQMHRLRNAVRETHMTFLERWFPDPQQVSRSTAAPVEYELHYDDKGRPQREDLTLNLRALASAKWVTKDMDEFYKTLPKWRLYAEDRKFPGDYAAPETVG